jgi:hypothetical protein
VISDEDGWCYIYIALDIRLGFVRLVVLVSSADYHIEKLLSDEILMHIQ